MRADRAIGLLATVCAAILSAACTSGTEDPASADLLADGTVTVASFNFPESELLAEIYGQALADAGYGVELALDVGPRELVQPALSRGLVEFVPEYAGTALAFLSLGRQTPLSDVRKTYEALRDTLDDTNIVALRPAAAQNANAFVVTSETAERHLLRDLSDLERVASRLTLGGAPECPTRPFCLLGLRETYGLEFESFVPLDVGGPLTLQALEAGGIDVALLFTTDPNIVDEGLVALIDDRELQPAENVVPLVRREIVERAGDTFTQVVDGVSSRLTTEVLRGLNSRMARGADAADVARAWLSGFRTRSRGA